MSEIKKNAQEIFKLTQDMLALKKERDEKLGKIRRIEQQRIERRLTPAQYDKQIKIVTSGKSIADYDHEIRGHIGKINELKEAALKRLNQPAKPRISAPRTSDFDLGSAPSAPDTGLEVPLPENTIKEVVREAEGVLESIDEDSFKINKRTIKRFVKSMKEPEKENIEQYTVYKPHWYAKISHFFMGELVFNLSNKYKDFYEHYNEKVHLANIKLMTKTYLSIALFSTVISLPLFALVAFLYFLSIWHTVIIGVLGMIVTGALFYAYPGSVIRSRQNKIKVELVFATVHMSAVSGSGANPEKIFKLLVDSKEYPDLEPDLKRILNNLNLFGYNLTTSLKSVANSTASPDFKELLNGMVSTIETGGDLTKYLQEKSRDSLDTFRLDQKKYLARLSNFSDVYTGLLIAAPLLFIITLAVLEKISPEIGGIPITTIATLGTYVGLPLLNAAFLTILNVFQPEL
tara:strand:- start:15822 stop:17201 length:1380 start_codon:yes stop_codon:yes gene_type:complete